MNTYFKAIQEKAMIPARGKYKQLIMIAQMARVISGTAFIGGFLLNQIFVFRDNNGHMMTWNSESMRPFYSFALIIYLICTLSIMKNILHPYGIEYKEIIISFIEMKYNDLFTSKTEFYKIRRYMTDAIKKKYNDRKKLRGLISELEIEKESLNINDMSSEVAVRFAVYSILASLFIFFANKWWNSNSDMKSSFIIVGIAVVYVSKLMLKNFQAIHIQRNNLLFASFVYICANEVQSEIH